MTRYWVIAPYDSTKTQIFEKVWEYDLNNGTIAVGWSDLGDVSEMSKPELESRYKEVYGEINNRDINAIWKFYHEISIGDIIIARRGTKKIIGIGTVTGKPFYSEEKGKERVANLTEDFYPNFISVKWEEKEIEFDKPVFSFYTLYEIPEEKYHSLVEGEIGEERPEETEPEFVLEKYLEDFIVSNFDSIFKGKYTLYVDSEGNIGQQYPTEVGYIDILAKEPESNSYVVIELKKGRESDKVVGQVLRYMGWVKENLCKEGEDVKGLIICKGKDEKLDYALKFVQDTVKLKYYKVDFQLVDPS
ncbi:hypothetical protein DRO97_02355 [Archaeoglobales archaeon]|nr:MAG: hypothetical protein DRO97_02355 [Archaeoglobales archaeon]